MPHWREKHQRVVAAIELRRTPFGQMKVPSRPVIVCPLLLRPGEKPLRGKPDRKDWRLELLFKPSSLPKPALRKMMGDLFGLPLCSVRRETPNPNNPLPQSVDGWWWHGGCWLSDRLAHAGYEPVSHARIVGDLLGKKFSVWLEASAAGQTLQPEPHDVGLSQYALAKDFGQSREDRRAKHGALADGIVVTRTNEQGAP